MKVPFVDLAAQHAEVRNAIDAAIGRAIDTSSFIGGPEVVGFEEEFAAYCEAPHAIAVASGTDALELSLRAMGVGAGDIVVTVPNSFIATVEAIVQVGAEPRFVDVESDSTMSVRQLQQYITTRCEVSQGRCVEVATGKRVAAVIPVHLYGLPARLGAIIEVAAGAGIEVLEDACQAHGATLQMGERTARVGGLGRAGCFSFYPGKNLGALGEAGAVVTHDANLAAEIRMLRDHGQQAKYVHVSAEGVNARMDAIQAAVLRIKLAHLETWNAMRQEAATWYMEDLSGRGIGLPEVPEDRASVHHLFVVEVPNRDSARAALEAQGIGTGIHYPIPLHLQPALAHLGLSAGTFPATERAAERILSLPMFPHITREQVRYVSEALRREVA